MTNLLQKYPSLSTKEIDESTRILRGFEQAERAKRDLEAASNTLESLVYDTSVKLDEEWANRHDFAEDFKKIREEVEALKVWIEDEAHSADVTTLKKKRDGLSSLILAVHRKEKKQREQKEAEIKVDFSQSVILFNFRHYLSVVRPFLLARRSDVSSRGSLQKR